MRTKKSFFSLVVALVMLLGMMGFSESKIRAEEDPRATNVTISDKGIMTWDSDGDYKYKISAYKDKTPAGSSYTTFYTTKREVNLFSVYSGNGCRKGDYDIRIGVVYTDEEQNKEIYELVWEGKYSFTPAKAELTMPANLRVEGNDLVWDASTAGGEEVTDTSVYYYCYVQKKSSITGEGVKSFGEFVYTNRIPLVAVFHPGVYDYSFKIEARAKGYPYSLEYKTEWKEYAYDCDYVQNLKLDENYQVTWDAYPNATSYDVEVRVDGLMSYLHNTQSTTQMGIAHLLDDYEETETMNVTIKIFALDENDKPISKYTTLNQQCKRITYPIKLWGEQLTRNSPYPMDDLLGCSELGLSSRVKYESKSNTLTFVNFDMKEYEDKLKEVYGESEHLPYDENFIVTSTDLTIKGKAYIFNYGMCFVASGSKLVLETDSDITCESENYALWASEIVFKGKSFSAKADVNYGAVCLASQNITIAKNCQSLYVESLEEYPAILCRTGKITMNGHNIIEPKGGTLSPAGNTIFDKNGDVALKVLIKGPTPTPTKKTTPTPTKKVTPKPTKKVTPTPTKKATPTPTKKATPKPTKKVTPTPTKKATPTPTKKVTPTPTKKVTPTPTKKVTPTPTKKVTPTPTKKVTPTPTKKVTPTPTKKVTPTPTKKVTPTPTKKVTPTPTKKVTPTPTPTKAPVKDPSFEDFVERLYVVALNRASEPEGKAFWVKQVVDEGKTGADCARFFLLDADEFMKRNLSVEDFVETLYKTFFDRSSDAAGKKGWVDAIKSGKMTRAEVVENFIESTEWCDVCATYGVKSGAKWHKATKPSKNATEFATRLFTCCLKRDPDAEGVKYWALALTNLEQTGCSAAKEFFTSKEFKGFNTSNEEYIKRLYTTFMGREPAADEVKYWTGELKAGRQSRESIMAFFGQSEEFTKICKQYGIERGEI